MPPIWGLTIVGGVSSGTGMLVAAAAGVAAASMLALIFSNSQELLDIISSI